MAGTKPRQVSVRSALTRLLNAVEQLDFSFERVQVEFAANELQESVEVARDSLKPRRKKRTGKAR